MVIGKITLTFTNRVVLTADVSFNPQTEIVSLPPHMAEAITFFQEGDCLPQIELAVDDRHFEVVQGSDGLYAARAKPALPTQSFLSAGFRSLARPTELQSQQMGRTSHTLAIAALLGAISVAHSYGTELWTASSAVDVCMLGVLFVLLLSAGNQLMEKS